MDYVEIWKKVVVQHKMIFDFIKEIQNFFNNKKNNIWQNYLVILTILLLMDRKLFWIEFLLKIWFLDLNILLRFLYNFVQFS